jgi:hypothetical protein
MESYKSISDLPEIGLLLISSRDPFSKLTQCIIGQSYTILGFFYSSTSTGFNNRQIIIFDLVNARIPEWVIPGDTLLTLIENPLIEKIRIKPLVTSVSSERIQQIFRNCLLEMMETLAQVSISSSLKNLFNHTEEEIIDQPIQLCNEYQAIRLINRILQRLEVILDIPFFPKTSSLFDSRASYKIRNRIHPSQLFPNWFKLIISRNTEENIINKINSTLVVQDLQLNAYFSNFLDLITKDYEFQQLISQKNIRNLHRHTFLAQNLVTILGQNGIDFLNLIQEWFQTGVVCHSKFESLFQKINLTTSVANSWLSSTKTKASNYQFI